MFHLMPYRDLPADYAQRYNASHIDPLWFDVADADKVGQYYNDTLDEMLHAAKAGLHGLCTNQHHQNVYGFMANPSIMGGVLAKQTNGQNVAIIQLGSTLPSTTPPTRIAEEYAMLDCISGGRLVAGFPTGLPSDATISNAVIPVEQRERYREALALVTKAWSARELFAWNGRHYQLGMVNLWPRPIQQPHPPIWIPGAGLSSTAEYVVGLDHCFCHLSYYGAKNAGTVSDRYWELCANKGRDDNPYRYSFLQLIGVGETDAEAEELYAPHAEYFFHKLLYNPPTIRRSRAASITTAWCRRCITIHARASICASSRPRTSTSAASSSPAARRPCATISWRASSATASAICSACCISARCRPSCARRISTCSRARCCLPLAPLWDDTYEDRWWPERLRQKRPSAGTSAPLAAAS